jgi:FkbM family methyltransferase
MTARPSASVVICAYTHHRWALLSKTIESVQSQGDTPPEILLVVDHNPGLAARAREAFAGTRVVANEEARGLSGARNTGVRHSTGDVLAFLDDDATANPGWLETLLAAFETPAVMGAGGSACAVWEEARPEWLPDEFLWVVGASYRGLPVHTAPVRNPIGANMAFRREAFARAGGFTDGIGRIGKTPLGCEETEFSIRLRQTVPGALILYMPDARVDHHVPADRATRGYFLSRCWAEGVSKALVAARVGDEDGLASERAYVTGTLTAGLLNGLRAALAGDTAALGRCAAIMVGLMVTTAGFIKGRLCTGQVIWAPAVPRPARRTTSGRLKQYRQVLRNHAFIIRAASGNSERAGILAFVCRQYLVHAGLVQARDLEVSFGGQTYVVEQSVELHTLAELHRDRFYSHFPEFAPRPGTNVIDVGANVGVFSIYHAAAGADVLAIEPNPSAHRRLLAGLAANGLDNRVTVVQAALAERKGRGRLVAAGGLTVLGRVKSVPADDDGIGDVDVLTLDEVLSAREPRDIDLLKIDVEGGEASVLRGASLVLDRVRRILLEYHSSELLAETRRLVTSAGFEEVGHFETAPGIGMFYAER